MNDCKGGVLQLLPNRAGFLRNPGRSFKSGPDDIYVPKNIVSQYGLIDGAYVIGLTQPSQRKPELIHVESVCGLSPESYMERQKFRDMTAVIPSERFNFSTSKSVTLRILDCLTPIGKGTRGLIVSPPRAGKTMLLEEIARGINENDPETRVIVLLIDERPEEVTHFRRHVSAEVLASSMDQSVEDHIILTELTMNHIKTELECGKDVVVLVDSLTRMGRAFNVTRTRTGRTLSGGMEARALEIPRRFFGMARQVENGGSITIIATILIETGSRLDQVIFEEFKGTGNSEIVLDRRLAEARIFPAIDIQKSGTRREEALYHPSEHEKRLLLRRGLTDLEKAEAIKKVLQLMEKFPDTDRLLRTI